MQIRRAQYRVPVVGLLAQRLLGAPLGAGPGRAVGGAIPIDTYNITSLLSRSGGGYSTLAVEAYYRRRPDSAAAGDDHDHDHDDDDDDRGGVWVMLHDGAGRPLRTGCAAAAHRCGPVSQT